MDPILQLLGHLLPGPDLGGSLTPLIQLIGNTPLELATANPVIDSAWHTMVIVADSFLGLIVMIGAIQMMYGQATGTLYLPASQFVPRIVLTAILIHLSFILGQDLILINNALCGLVHADIAAFVHRMNGGQPLNFFQNLGIATVLGLGFVLSLIRVVFQAVKRVVFFNVLFVLSGPAFLLSLHPQTTPWFSFWARTYLVTAFTQFLQFLTLGLGLQFLLATNQGDTTSFILAIALLNLTAEIPGLLSRFSTSASASPGGLGTLASVAVTFARLAAA